MTPDIAWMAYWQHHPVEHFAHKTQLNVIAATVAAWVSDNSYMSKIF